MSTPIIDSVITTRWISPVIRSSGKFHSAYGDFEFTSTGLKIDDNSNVVLNSVLHASFSSSNFYYFLIDVGSITDYYPLIRIDKLVPQSLEEQMVVTTIPKPTTSYLFLTSFLDLIKKCEIICVTSSDGGSATFYEVYDDEGVWKTGPSSINMIYFSDEPPMTISNVENGVFSTKSSSKYGNIIISGIYHNTQTFPSHFLYVKVFRRDFTTPNNFSSIGTSSFPDPIIDFSVSESGENFGVYTSTSINIIKISGGSLVPFKKIDNAGAVPTLVSRGLSNLPSFLVSLIDLGVNGRYLSFVDGSSVKLMILKDDYSDYQKTKNGVSSLIISRNTKNISYTQIDVGDKEFLILDRIDDGL